VDAPRGEEAAEPSALGPQPEVQPRSGGLFAPLFADPDGPLERFMGALQALYAIVFLAQSGLALLVALPLALTQPTARAHDVLAAVLLGMMLVLIAAGIGLANLLARPRTRPAAVAAVLAAGVSLAGTTWFAALLLLSDPRPLVLVASVSLMAVAYAFGLLTSVRIGRRVATAPADKEPT